MNRLTKEQRRKNMQNVKSKDSEIELNLRRELWKRGFRYRKNVRSIFGCPDIVFKGLKIAVFCDSEFWHGYDWERRKNDFKSNREFWIPKIERNIQRDKEVNKKLTSEGWKVLRFWGNDIKKNLDGCVKIISDVIAEKKSEVKNFQ